MIGAAALLFAALLATLALARRLALLRAFATLGATGRKAVRVMARRGASDWSRERAARILAMRMLARSLHAGLRLLVATLPLALAVGLGPRGGIPVGAALVDPMTRFGLLGAMGGVALIRARRRPKVRHDDRLRLA